MTKRENGLKRRVLLIFAITVTGLLLMGWSGANGPPARVVSDPHSAFQSRMLEVGEELEYKVSYSFFTIGTIRTQVLSRETRNGRIVYKTRALIESNPSLSWLVDLHIRFYSEMDGSIYSYYWLSDDSTSKEVNFRRFRFDYDNNRAYLERGKRINDGVRKVESTDTVKITGQCQDGLSLFFYAREHVHYVGQDRIPTLIEDKQASTYINFTNKRTDMEIDAVDYPVDVVAFDGKADYVGIFGLTGGFRGWFSNDEHQVPIVARMNVILGSIKIQLAKWNRPGWQPPKYVETPAK
ncbi:MAG: hypothetical protein A2X66_00755 [Ignavibacteria bacterium GWA2_54_16]|nr:MAG: hypothetical protein A2X66_00755 [Ignavibacteria bacterium GWA2_54_16]